MEQENENEKNATETKLSWPLLAIHKAKKKIDSKDIIHVAFE